MRHALLVVRRLLGAKLQPQAELLQGEQFNSPGARVLLSG